ncbi:glycosyltransferase involved in cell wall biosynthesis [Fontibacillus phaseoli]|uniref:Glycosyltransferase involved in cell wall biosynthesis n=1 Tax=Fontibacillus phaseoli TaxID=1416533 RepID=A0A369BC44_9BACL|nr:glycosyltransferase family 4 protein [Fontibacillus phaseoli]RCX18146.1 glycosyltransferase involved in cell wall biosynthesis [Fontibacillus phaseoli]
MKILLVQSMEYLYPYGGAHKANRILMEGLAAKGHECRVISPAVSITGFEELLAAQRRSGAFEVLEDHPGEKLVILKSGVISYTIKERFKVFPFIRSMIEQFSPDITVVSEDNTHLLLETVLETRTRTIFLSHSQATLPFGPECFQEDLSKIDLYKRLDGIISVSQYLKDYFTAYAGVDSEVIYFPSYGPGPFPFLASFDNMYITAINPSAIKGFSIFIGLARRMPHLNFAAVPTWATKEDELEEMRTLPNMTILKPAENINDIYKQTKVFLMPSLWGESFGQVVVEAMLRGIPVLASHVGGLPEAKMQLDYILPVRPIRQYVKEEVLANSVPIPVIPEQELGPWVGALDRLASDRDHYESLSAASYEHANRFHASLGIEPFEAYFRKVIDKAEDRVVRLSEAVSAANEANNLQKRDMLERIQTFPSEKRERLLAMLQERR